MTENKEGPSVDELQKKVAELTEKISGYEAEKTKAEAVSQQLAALQKKYEELTATNMKLIKYIPSSGSQTTEDKPKKDINCMTEDERYAYLKDMAVKSFEKKKE